jgi:hypothetical protein
MLHIVTPCYNTQNLATIHTTLPKACSWIVCCPDNINAPQLTNTTLLSCDKTNSVVDLLNYVLDNFPFDNDDHIVYVNDHNIVHPRLYDSVSPLLNQDFSLIQWGQIHKDGVIRLPPMPYCVPGSLDLSSFLVKYNNNKSVRFNPVDQYYAYYAIDCCKNGPIIQVNDYLCYYNYLG